MIFYPREEGEVLDRDPETQALFQWAEFLGIKLNEKIMYPVRFSPGYLGVQTSGPLYPGESILSAPNQAMLSMKHMNHQSLQVVYTAHPELYSVPDKTHEDNRMLTFFLWELSKGTSSFWYPYFEFLPKDLETLVDWNKNDLIELQDPDLQYMVEYKKKNDFQNYKQIQSALKKYPDLFCEEDITIEKIHWVWKIICTRSYSGRIPYTTLIPIADLFNHSNVNMNYFYGADTDTSPDAEDLQLEEILKDDDDPMVEEEKTLQLSDLKLYRLSLGPTNSMNDQQLKISNEVLNIAKTHDQLKFLQSILYLEMTTATKGAENTAVGEEESHKFRITCSKFEHHEAGAQVFIKYGSYSNRQLLMHYGFAMRENIYNYARIKVRLEYFLSAPQAAALGKGYSPDMLTVFKLKSTEFCTELLKTLRSFSWTIDSNAVDTFFFPSDLDLEITCLEKMRNLLVHVLASFQTSIEEDLSLTHRSCAKLYFAVIIS